MRASGKRRAGVAAAALGLLVLAGLAAIGAKHKPATPARPSGPRAAPPITSRDWINSKRLTQADLAGKVRVVEFWTLGSEHCERTVIAMRELHGLYLKKGVVILGVHSPRSAHAVSPAAVAAAVTKDGIRFPVALDNDRKDFEAFKNRYWPVLYLIDREGIVRATHVGELHVGTRAWGNFSAAIESVLIWKTDRRS